MDTDFTPHDASDEGQTAAEKRGCSKVLFSTAADFKHGATDQGRSASGSSPPSERYTGLIFERVEPWPESVDGGELLFSLLHTLRRFIVLPNPGELVIVLWIVHTYAFDLAQTSPILGLVSPERRCGKTTLLALLEALACRALMAAHITPAALFRTVEAVKPTLLIDELDTHLHRNSDLRNVLNAGHCRQGRVIRADGPGRQPRGYSVYCPKALAKIGPLPSTLQDRSIVVEMGRRSHCDRTVEILSHTSIHDELRPLRKRVLRWTQDSRDALREANPVQPEELHARAQDNWRQLLLIADLCGQVWADGARAAAVALAKGGGEDPLGTQLLQDIRSIIAVRAGADRIPSAELAGMLAMMEDRPWYDWPGRKGFSAHQLARLLRPYKIMPKVLWWGGFGGQQAVRGYLFKHFDDAFKRYLEPSPVMKERLPKDPGGGKLRAFSKNRRG